MAFLTSLICPRNREHNVHYCPTLRLSLVQSQSQFGSQSVEYLTAQASGGVPRPVSDQKIEIAFECLRATRNQWTVRLEARRAAKKAAKKTSYLVLLCDSRLYHHSTRLSNWTPAYDGRAIWIRANGGYPEDEFMTVWGRTSTWSYADHFGQLEYGIKRRNSHYLIDSDDMED